MTVGTTGSIDRRTEDSYLSLILLQREGKIKNGTPAMLGFNTDSPAHLSNDFFRNG